MTTVEYLESLGIPRLPPDDPIYQRHVVTVRFVRRALEGSAPLTGKEQPTEGEQVGQRARDRGAEGTDESQ